MSDPELKVLAYGDHGVLVQCADLRTVMALRAWLEEVPIRGQREIIPGAATILIRLDHDADPAVVAGQLPPPGVLSQARPETGSGGLTIEVVYDGPDLAEIAELTGLTIAEVVRAHTESAWTVAFTGFAPGFGYLTGGDPRLNVPRRPDPRSKVPAGAVGLAGEFSGIYPRSSPGGWQLLGHTDAVLWDENRDPPALLAPGTIVRFVQVPG